MKYSGTEHFRREVLSLHSSPLNHGLVLRLRSDIIALETFPNFSVIYKFKEFESLNFFSLFCVIVHSLSPHKFSPSMKSSQLLHISPQCCRIGGREQWFSTFGGGTALPQGLPKTFGHIRYLHYDPEQ